MQSLKLYRRKSRVSSIKASGKIKIRKFFYYFIGLLGFSAFLGQLEIRSIRLISLAYAQDSIIGEVQPPGWLGKHGSTEVGGEGGFGLINFFSNVLRLLTIVAGLFAVINLILSGLEFISSQGDPEKIKSAQGKIWNSLIGLVIIAASYTLAAIFGWLLFGDATMIISPKIYGPTPDVFVP